MYVTPEHPGYEITDVNVNGVVVFLAGLFGSVLSSSVFCFVHGQGDQQRAQEDGWTGRQVASQRVCRAATNGKRQDLASNPEMQQKELQQMTATFPSPRLDIDDGNQADG